jgi:multicomponent Na+:H+ antiporter subunit B
MRRIIALVAVIFTGFVLIYGTLDFPVFGEPQSPNYTHIVPRWIQNSETESGVPNIVTAGLANYRGYDTLGETSVIFTAGITVILLLRTRKKEVKR